MRRFAVLAPLLWALGLASPASGEDAPPVLEKNPFVSPLLGERSAQRDPPSDVAPPALELRAVLLAGDRSTVNVGGVLLGLGDELQGHRLIAVNEKEAVFERDGERMRMTLPERETETPAPVGTDNRYASDKR